jgi:tripartite ATP-independent transporter DctM subunit
VLIGLFIVYIVVYSWWRPRAAPVMDRQLLKAHPDRSLGLRVVKSLLPPLILVIAVLGSIFFGIASPTESAALGALGAMVLAATHQRLTLVNLVNTMRGTTRLTSMVFIILVGASAFGLVFRGLHGDSLVHEFMTSLPGGVWGFIAISMLVIFLLGFFLDFLEIVFIVVPILVPIALHLGIDMTWFAILIALNLQSSFLTPPFGFSLFYLKAAAPPGIRFGHIARGAMPFVGLQFLALALVMAFPGLAHWLPELMD